MSFAIKSIRLIMSFLFLSMLGCASLHHVQIGSIDNRSGKNLKPIEVLVSGTGVNMDDVKQVANQVLGSKRGGKQAGQAADTFDSFQMGPKTGEIVYNEKYADNVTQMLREKCPNGRITGVTSIRETMKYPVISGEIVKFRAYCIE